MTASVFKPLITASSETEAHTLLARHYPGRAHDVRIRREGAHTWVVEIAEEAAAQRILQQRLEHLERAIATRTRITQVKRELQALGRVASAHRLAQLLEQQDETVMRMRAQAALLAARGIGVTKARHILRAADITVGSTRIGMLSPRQRGRLAEQLRETR